MRLCMRCSVAEYTGKCHAVCVRVETGVKGVMRTLFVFSLVYNLVFLLVEHVQAKSDSERMTIRYRRNKKIILEDAIACM